MPAAKKAPMSSVQCLGSAPKPLVPMTAMPGGRAGARRRRRRRRGAAACRMRGAGLGARPAGPEGRARPGAPPLRGPSAPPSAAPRRPPPAARPPPPAPAARPPPPAAPPPPAPRTAVDIGEGRGVGAPGHVDLPRAVEQHEGHRREQRAHQLAHELRAKHRARRGEADVARPARGEGGLGAQGCGNSAALAFCAAPRARAARLRRGVCGPRGRPRPAQAPPPPPPRRA